MYLDLKSGRPGLTLGEKFPRAYFHLDAITARFDAAGEGLKMIVLVRDIEEIANSWYRRAINQNDKSWHRGMRGVFPYLEEVILASQLCRMRRPEDVLLVSYAKYLDPAFRVEVLAAVADHLGVSGVEQMIAVLDAEAEKTARSLSRDRSEDAVDFHSKSPFFQLFTDIVDAPGTSLLTQIQPDLRRMVADLWDDGSFVAEVLAHLSAETNPDILVYQSAILSNYRDVFSTFDRHFAADLERAMASQHRVARDRMWPDKFSRYFDLTDTIDFVSAHGGVTGIQRVQLDAILAIARSVTDDDNLGVLLDPDRGWVLVPLKAFAELCTNGGNLQSSFREFVTQLGGLEPAIFAQGDVIYLLGGTWTTPSLLDSLVPLRLQGVRTVFYLHDLLPLEVPEHFTVGHCGSFMHWLKSCLSCADGIICNSMETREALRKYTDFEGAVTVANLNIVPSFVEEFKALPIDQQDAPLEEFGLAGREYVLMVGTLEPRKNHTTAFNVWSTLIRRLGNACPVLVLVGKPGWMSGGITETITTNRFPGKIMALTDVDDQSLAALYKNAVFSLSISRREGWNLPITEALALGTPCVTGAGSAAQEAMQGLTYLVDELSERDIAEKIEELLKDRSALDALRNQIATRARFKTWHDFSAELRAFDKHLKLPASLPVPTIALKCSYTFGTDQTACLTSAAPTGLQLRSGLGWNTADPWGTWSRKAEAELVFGVPTKGAFILYAIVTPTLAHHRLPLSVSIGEATPWHGTLHPGQRSLVMLEFHHPEADRAVTVRFTSGPPHDFSTDDTSADIRTLGFALIDMCVVAKADKAGRLEVLESMVQTYLSN